MVNINNEMPFGEWVDDELTERLGITVVDGRKVMINRVYSGDELTIMGSKLEIVNIIAGLAGSGLAMVVPCTTTWIGGLVLVAVTVLTVANYYQIKYLLLLQPSEDE